MTEIDNKQNNKINVIKRKISAFSHGMDFALPVVKNSLNWRV